MRTTRLLRHAVHGPWGDSTRHLPLAELESGLAALAPPLDAGVLALIVARGDDGERATPAKVTLTPESGVPDDAWLRDCPEQLDAQITIIREDFARLAANGQALSLFGDNLVVDLDLSLANLPTGSRLRLGGALLEVTPEPHTGCAKFRQRFGGDALRLTADRRFRDLRLRGIYVKVVEAGEIARGDTLEVVNRTASAATE
jgi:MOSC domain-containing protein YiiM